MRKGKSESCIGPLDQMFLYTRLDIHIATAKDTEEIRSKSIFARSASPPLQHYLWSQCEISFWTKGRAFWFCFTSARRGQNEPLKKGCCTLHLRRVPIAGPPSSYLCTGAACPKKVFVVWPRWSKRFSLSREFSVANDGKRIRWKFQVSSHRAVEPGESPS